MLASLALITSLANTTNKTIKNSPKTLLIVNNSLEKYKRLLNNSNLVVKELIVLNMDSEGKTKITEFHDLFVKYLNDRERLASIVNNLKKYQASLKIYTDTETLNAKDVKSRNLSIYIIMLMLIVIVLFFMRKRA